MNSSYTRYSHLIKPKFAPPSWIFGPVWTLLYTLIAISYGYTIYLAIVHKIPGVVLIPFILNIIFNALFTFFEFKLKSNVLALIDVVLVWATLLWAIVVIFPYVSWVAYINLPYLAWTSFAMTLQVTVTYLNRNRS